MGLFTIPEYPELEVQRGMWSAALDAILTTLRYLAPATLLTIFWGQQSFLFKLLKHVDSAFRAIFSSEEQKQAVLQWVSEAGPVRIEHLDTVWRHGWILCRVLDMALPGACAGHPPTRLSMKHAQAIAEHYLGVHPVFTDNELESNDSLSRHQEWKLATYLDHIRQALSKITPSVIKPVSQKTSPETTQLILDYVAKGCGLSAVQINNKAHFKIYPTTQQSIDPGEITILIRGPKDTYGMAVIPPILGKAQTIRNKVLGLQTKQTYTETVLPVTQGVTYLRNFGKNDMNKTYYIPKTQYDIEISFESQADHIKISYMVKLEGKYLVSITSRGQNIAGSPFTVTATNNIISVLEKDSFCLEHGEEIDIVDIENDRKVVLRIVDFITEKMLLKENGTLEKISDEEARLLMTVNKERFDNIERESCTKSENSVGKILDKSDKFKKVASKILIMHRVCKIFRELYNGKELKSKNETKNSCMQSRNQQGIPDIVNSTFTDVNVNPYIASNKREKFIVPECISVSLRAEISKTLQDDTVNEAATQGNTINNDVSSIGPHTPDSLEIQTLSSEDEEDHNSTRRTAAANGNNPFLKEMFDENYATANNYSSYAALEYESNNSQQEETKNSAIKIIVNPDLTSPIFNSATSLRNNNPFIKADVTDFDRPKSPVFKIISGEKFNRGESVFIDSKNELISEEDLGNEFVNPFFVHQLQGGHFDSTPMADFIIGAPVSLPPIIRTSTPDPEMKSLIITSTENTEMHTDYDKNNKYIDVIADSIYSTPLHNSTSIGKDDKTDNFNSMDSNSTGNMGNSNASTASDSQFDSERNDSNRDVTSRKDMWDSAYVSIDDNNSSPDSNNNEHFNLSYKLNSPNYEENSELKQKEISNMGPAEREIWQPCNEINYNTNKLHEEIKSFKWEIKRPMFTPIIEESDRSISSGTKESLSGTSPKQAETDTVSVAFAELNDIYLEHFPNSETNATAVANDNIKSYCMAVEYPQTNNTSVNSASEKSDVKRHENDLEGTISEVQPSVTESVSVSQILRNEQNNSNDSKKNESETSFGENRYSNIVLEKKKYWDERIKEIEAREQEVIVPKKKRISSKQLKHDSLSKRKGKQMIKNFLSSGDYSQVTNINQIDDKELSKSTPTQTIAKRNSLIDSVRPDEKLVPKWKRYWDDKLEINQLPIENKQSSIIPRKNNLNTKSSVANNTDKSNINEIKLQDTNQIKKKSTNTSTNEYVPVKQELPEEIFKAFETSPKRFFGTSRKQILNKFLGKPENIDTSATDVSMSCHESGLVSSRISLFHNMTNVEELPWVKRKTQSMNNIYQRRESEKNESLVSVKNNSNIIEIKQVEPQVTIPPTHTTETTKSYIAQVYNRKKDIPITSDDSLEKTVFEANTDTALKEREDKHTYNTLPEQNKYVSNTTKILRPNVETLRKKSFSKSEMDIFNKSLNNTIDDLDKYKSYDELPKINVKSFISLYESVFKTTDKIKPAKRVYRTSSTDSYATCSNSTTLDAVSKRNFAVIQASSNNESKCNTPGITPTNLWTNNTSQTVSNMNLDTKISNSNYDEEPNDKKETIYVSLSDIELEIIENETSSNKIKESSPEPETKPEHIEYKNRFKLAKEYFQSLEELRQINKPRKLNECELLLRKQSIESLENEPNKERPQKRVKKNIKSHSLPSTEIARGWGQLHSKERCASEECSSGKLVKISEKFNVDDLFSDVTEGKLSRQGSLRGIPHKKAVLEAFRSMENVANTSLSSYDISDSQMTDFSKEHRVTNAQTYLSEYPYLPKTDPSQYHSRIDVKASGLISFKELKEKKLRRNSVPDLRLNPDFTIKL